MDFPVENSDSTLLKKIPRPVLSVNTNILSPKKKRWSGLLSKNKQDSPTKANENLVESPSNEKSFEDPDQKPTLIPKRSSSENYSKFKKKFHLPTFCKQETKPVSYTPEVPEPIMPSLVDWAPETPLTPPPWELQETTGSLRKRHSLSLSKSYSFTDFHEDDSESLDTDEEDTAYHSDPELLNSLNDMSLGGLSSDVTLTASTESRNNLRRRSSCPDYDTISLGSPSTMVEKDILWITEQSTRDMSIFKKHTSTDKKVSFKPCQKAAARAAEAAVNGDIATHHAPLYMHFCEETLRHMYIPNVFDPVSRELVVQFTNIKPRQYRLRRKISWRKEAKALMIWHDTLKASLEQPKFIHSQFHQKKEKYMLTRRFILREFYTTEVNFWNQLYYTKIVFYDALVFALDRDGKLPHVNGADGFANLFDLMKFSAKLIHRLRHLQFDSDESDFKTLLKDTPANCNIQLGKILCEMSEDLVVFLRCALDYRENRKLLQHKMYESYRQRLYTRKETSQFTMEDYLIIPIQRVARYGLLLNDLIRHSDPNMLDYKYLIQAHKIITSLATAMNLIQKKPK